MVMKLFSLVKVIYHTQSSGLLDNYKQRGILEVMCRACADAMNVKSFSSPFEERLEFV